MGIPRGVDGLFPELHRDIVRDQLALARIFEECLADLRPGIDGPKDIAARTMIEPGDSAERFALGAFATAGRTKQDKSSILHHKGLVIPQSPKTGKGNYPRTAYLASIRSTLTRRPPRSNRTLPSTSANIV